MAKNSTVRCIRQCKHIRCVFIFDVQLLYNEPHTCKMSKMSGSLVSEGWCSLWCGVIGSTLDTPRVDSYHPPEVSRVFPSVSRAPGRCGPIERKAAVTTMVFHCERRTRHINKKSEDPASPSVGCWPHKFAGQASEASRVKSMRTRLNRSSSIIVRLVLSQS